MITPQERAKAYKNRSILTKEQGPTSRHQTDSFVAWQRMSDILGQPFDVNSVPLSKLYQMRRDPMIAFALTYVKVPLVRAPWYIQSESAQISAFVDNALRQIYGRLIFQFCTSMEFGFQAIEKRFELFTPDWKYYNDETGEQELVWPDQDVKALVWKPFISLPPESVSPKWNNSGEFDGISFNSANIGVYGSQALRWDSEQIKNIDIEHALWITNDKDSVFGSLWGYPRIGYAFRYWWSYWYAWALSDRHYEKDADPATLVRYPEGRVLDDDGNEVDMRSLALQLGEDVRSGSTIAMPSKAALDMDGKTTGRYEWDIAHVTSGGNFQAFSDRFNYLDVMKLRSIMVPENSLIEGSGGCLLGDTPILMPRDHDKYPDGIPLKDVKPGQLVWSYNEEKSSFDLRPVKSVFKTMENAEVYKLTLDDGSEVIGTPDHPFMKRDGTWVEMIALEPGDQLMPLYEGSRSKYYDGREAAEGDCEPTVMLDPDDGKYLCEYRFIAQYLDWYESSSDKINVHHIDNRHANTDISNLEPLTLSDHAKKHFADEHWKAVFSQKVKRAMAELDDETRSRIAREHWSQEEWDAYKDRLREPGREAMVGYLESLDEDARRDFLSDRTKAGWENGSRDLSQYAWKAKDCIKCGSSYKPTHSVQKYCTDCVEQARQEYVGRVKRGNDFASKECIKCSDTFKPSSGNQKNCFNCMKVVVNHKVVSVEKCGREDVWDISIDGPEHCKNYVANGVVVHNTSSRNVADAMGDIFYESQAVTMADIDDHINRFIIPQIVVRNFPEYTGEVKKVTRGFSQADISLAKQIVQLIGQTDPNKLEVDVRTILEQAGVPLLSPQALGAKHDEINKELEQVVPDDIEPGGGKAGVKGGIYVNDKGKINLSLSDAKSGNDAFLHPEAYDNRFEDEKIAKIGQNLYKIWEDAFKEAYASAAKLLKEKGDSLSLAEDDDNEASNDSASKFLKAWVGLKFIKKAVNETRSQQEILMDQASNLELAKVEITEPTWDAKRPEAQKWLNDHGAELLQNVSDTTKEEVRAWLAANFNKGLTPSQIAESFATHFSDYPSWKAARVVRTEVRDAYNASTLLSGEAEGCSQVIASDASGGRNINTDKHCINRNGKTFSIKKAMKEKDHPNGTLSWILVPPDVELSDTKRVLRKLLGLRG